MRLFPLSDALFHGLPHLLLTGCLKLFFHLAEACICFDLRGEQYFYLREGNLLVWSKRFSAFSHEAFLSCLITLSFGQNHPNADAICPHLQGTMGTQQREISDCKTFSAGRRNNG
jgi:hypothetical protein